MATDTQIAYAAGFFDGEGYIGICGSQSRGSLCLEIDVTQVDPRPLQFLAEHFGGKIKQRVRSKYTSTRNSRPSFLWRLHAKDAVMFLELIYPYLIHKRDQADLAFQFQRIRDTNKWRKGNLQKKQEQISISQSLRDMKKKVVSLVGS